MPVPSHVRDPYPAQFLLTMTMVAHRRVEVKDMREELWRQSGDRREDVAM
jgi:hypothetical protein